jgi:hypothetical protein
MTRADSWKKRPCVLRYFAWCDKAREAANPETKEKIDPKEHGIIGFWAFAHIEMPQSWTKKKRKALAGKLCDQKPDCSNIQKSLEDAIFTEDKWLHCPAVANKFWAHEDESPRIDVYLLMTPEKIPYETKEEADCVTEEEEDALE